MNPVSSQSPSLLEKRAARRLKKAEGRTRRAAKLRENKEFAKQYFEGKAKRAAEKKSLFKKKKRRKK